MLHRCASGLWTQKSQVSYCSQLGISLPSQSISLNFPVTLEEECWKFLFFFFFSLSCLFFLDSPCQHIHLENSYSLFKTIFISLLHEALGNLPKGIVAPCLFSHRFPLCYFPVNCLITSNWKFHLIRAAQRKCIDSKNLNRVKK